MTNRFSYVTSISCEDIFTDEVKELLIHLHDKFLSELDEIRKIRIENQALARSGKKLGHLEKSEANGEWSVEDLPAELRVPGIEISGPAGLTSMLINALNPGPNGVRAEGDLDDDEDLNEDGTCCVYVETTKEE